MSPSPPPPAADRLVLEDGRVYAEVTPAPLSLQALADWVAHPSAGAVATFTGATRDSFLGRATARLEYEAYVPMAAAKLRALCAAAAERWDLVKIAAAHRTGVVAVGEASVVVAASSAHRAEALAAVAWAVDELKATVPVWKKEIFEGGEVWQENPGARARLLAGEAERRAAAEAARRR